MTSLDKMEERFSLEKRWWKWQFNWLESQSLLRADDRWAVFGFRRLYALERLNHLHLNSSLNYLKAHKIDSFDDFDSPKLFVSFRFD